MDTARTPGPGAADPLVRRVALHFGQSVASVREVSGGYSAATRIVIRWRGGGSMFVKAATDAETATWLRAEHAVYARVRAPFLPDVLGWQDDGVAPWLALEDLSGAFWPPPWSVSRIGAVLETMALVAACPALEMPSMESRRREFAGWTIVAAEPEACLQLGVFSERWLSQSLATLLEAERLAVLEGDSLLHNDVRSDNLCFDAERVLLLDWNWACRGNPKLDVAAWLPSLALEGGPEPETFLRGEGALASFVAGFYAAHAGRPPLPGRPTLRALQLGMLRHSLAWTARELELPPPDGPRASIDLKLGR